MRELPLVVEPFGIPAGELEGAIGRASEFARKARADATQRAYQSDWKHFVGWCAWRGVGALPAEPATVGIYMADHAGILSVATLTRRLSSIATVHRSFGCGIDTKHPAIRDVMQGIRRSNGKAQKQAAALTVPLVKRAVAVDPAKAVEVIDLRDWALLLVGTAGGMRRSELVALDVADLTFVPEGIRIMIRRSKGDQEGAGDVIQVGRTGRHTCPVLALQRWLEAAHINVGRVFRSVDRHGNVGRGLSGRAVANVVKRRAELAGLDPKAFSGHSMRAGFATSAAEAGIGERDIARQTRHKSMTTLRRYIRDGELFRLNIATEVGL